MVSLDTSELGDAVIKMQDGFSRYEWVLVVLS